MALIIPLRGITPRIGRDCFLAENATVVGDVVMGDECSVWFNTVLRGDVNSIRIGNRVNIQDGSVLQTLVLGISGGQDSTLCGKLCQMAIEELRAETGDQSYRFIAVRLPYGTQADEQDALAAIDFMQADQTMRVNIKEASDAMVQAVEANGITISDFNKGNIKARQRMIAQYAIAGATSGAVVGTDHAAEAITGFYTKYGDGGADIMPLWRLDKRQGWRV